MGMFVGDTLIEEVNLALAIAIDGNDADMLDADGLVLSMEGNGLSQLVVAGNGEAE